MTGSRLTVKVVGLIPHDYPILDEDWKSVCSKKLNQINIQTTELTISVDSFNSSWKFQT